MDLMDFNIWQGLKARGNVEEWLGKVETAMFLSLWRLMKAAIVDFQEYKRSTWVLRHASQVITSCYKFVTQETTEQSCKIKDLLDEVSLKTKELNFSNNYLVAMGLLIWLLEFTNLPVRTSKIIFFFTNAYKFMMIFLHLSTIREKLREEATQFDTQKTSVIDQND